ncbi:DivIVA domain-containing protein [Catellatospora sp. KI3]|uniref:DivIVA domain-containing protein n=1 Tax=Catellatospora sp. KI3 TaxID=3041620 RepID=UPI002482D508|nr:DivIVA domain-containing protein [Catellatospora sp. KI3]MDI1460158.1 DivIVA domain-containing protein [Catellatospora sp. KI3]
MGNLLLLIVVALTVGAVVFGVMTLVTGGDPGLTPAEPDERATPLPADRPLVEGDVSSATFDVGWRGYRMAQVDQTLRRLAYDIGYKSELIQVLEAEVTALREGRVEDADTLARARASALGQATPPSDTALPAAEAETEPETDEADTAQPVEAEHDTDTDGDAAAETATEAATGEPVRR